MRGTVPLVLLACALAAAGCANTLDAAPSAYNATVIDVVDGDTLDVRYPNGSTDTVRLLGVDAPEVHGSVDPAEFGLANTTRNRRCLRAVGENATAFAAAVVADGTVRLEIDPASDRRGRYGRLLAYVTSDGTDLNERLLVSGHARVYASDFFRLDRYREAAATARRADRGVWACGR